MKDPIYGRQVVGDPMSQNDIRELLRRHVNESGGGPSALPAGPELDRLVEACDIGWEDPSGGYRGMDEPYAHAVRVSRDIRIALAEAGVGTSWGGVHHLEIHWQKGQSGGPTYRVELSYESLPGSRKREPWWTEGEGATPEESIARALTSGWTADRIGTTEPAIDALYWDSAVDTSQMKKVAES